MEHPRLGVMSRSRAKLLSGSRRRQHSEESDGVEEAKKQKNLIRVGVDFQAQIPEYRPESSSGYMDVMVWSPNYTMPDAKLDEYILVAKEKHGYNVEQALGMLLWYQHDVEKALAELPNFRPSPQEWCVEDRAVFEQAFSFHGKNFHLIQQMLPDKHMSSLVQFYYSWKKTRTRTSVIDRLAQRQVRKKRSEGVEEAEPGGNNGSAGDKTHTSDAHRGDGLISQNRPRCPQRPPKGLHLIPEDVSALTVAPETGAVCLRQMDMQLEALKRQVQSIRQGSGSIKRQLDGGINELRPAKLTTKNNARWSNEEQLLAVQAFRRYGKDLQAIADVIGNKTASQVRYFFISHRRRLNLEDVLHEWQAEHDANIEEDNEIHVSDPPGKFGSSPALLWIPVENITSTNSTPSLPLPPLLPRPSPTLQSHPHPSRLPPLLPRPAVPTTHHQGVL